VSRTYPSNLAEAGLALFSAWFGPHYARSLAPLARQGDEQILRVRLSVGRKWSLDLIVLNTLAPEAALEWEVARSALEQRLDAAGLRVALWVPRNAALPAGEPALSDVVLAVEQATPLDDGRREARFPARLFLRRTSTTGSVVTILGGLAPHWAQFTNRVPGSFQLNSIALTRLPASRSERDALAERIVLAAGQPLADESQEILAESAWTVNLLESDRSYVIGSPRQESDEQSAALRRNLRALLREAASLPSASADARALAVLGAATYAEEEKLSWALRGMDPALYAGFDILTVIADGVVKPLLQPGRATLPWDAPLPS
jgi:hypothetical protein